MYFFDERLNYSMISKECEVRLTQLFFIYKVELMLEPPLEEIRTETLFVHLSSQNF